MRIERHDDPADAGRALAIDLAIPTSNSIYRKLGYVPCGERESYQFA
jgi:hypothetical protein